MSTKVTFKYQTPISFYAVLNAIFLILLCVGVYILATRPQLNLLILAGVIALGILWLPMLAMTIYGLFYFKGKIIIEDEKVLLPNINYKGYKELEFSDLVGILVTYRGTGEAIQAKLRLRSGKKYVISTAAFADDEAFWEFVTIIDSRIAELKGNQR